MDRTGDDEVGVRSEHEAADGRSQHHSQDVLMEGTGFLEGSILVEIEVRDHVEHLRWTADALEGDAAALERIQRVTTSDLTDPVEFLSAVRGAFGDRARTRVRPT